MGIKCMMEEFKPDNWFSYSRFMKSFVQKEDDGIYILGSEIMTWLSENVEYPSEAQGYDDDGYSIGFGLYFENDEDAVLFRLTWCSDDN